MRSCWSEIVTNILIAASSSASRTTVWLICVPSLSFVRRAATGRGDGSWCGHLNLYRFRSRDLQQFVLQRRFYDSVTCVTSGDSRSRNPGFVANGLNLGLVGWQRNSRRESFQPLSDIY